MRANPLIVCLWACSESGSSPTSPGCELQVALSGAVTATFDRLDCQTALDLGGDPIFAFFPDHPSIMRLDVEPPVADGLGDFSIVSPSGFVWTASDCTYDIARFEGTGGDIRAAGSATCPPADPEAGTDAVVVGTFAFATF